MKKFALSIVTAALAFATTHAMASGNELVLNVSGTVQYQYTNSSSTTYFGKTKTQSFNNATIYNMISNAVANAGNGLAATLPAKGLIVFNPTGYDGKNDGFFYVTNTATGFYYPLSGYDVNSVYYSFIELDAWVITTDTDMEFGFGFPMDGSSTYNLNSSGNGSLTGKDTALLYIHDNPYVNDLSDHPGYLYSYSDTYGAEYDSEAFEIQGIMSINLTYKAFSITAGSISLTGTGNAKVNGSDEASVISGHASL